MKISGLQKTTLLDFPGHVACTIFTGGCNFRCPFCHNSELLDADAPAAYTEAEILDFLSRRRHVLDGVAITGGEPTLQPDLEDFIRQVRALGLKIKLDTNGYLPEVLIHLADEGLLDYAAMDIKSSREHYGKVAGVKQVDLARIEQSVDFLKKGSLPYEFRTTVVRELHEAEDFARIGEWLDGAEAYFLQNFKDNGNVLKQGYSAYTQKELSGFLPGLRRHIKNVHLRGIDYEED